MIPSIRESFRSRAIVARNSLLVLPVLLSVLACASTGPKLTPNETLPGTRWRLVAMDDQSLTHSALPTLVFEDQSLVGDTGCNQYWSSVAFDRETIDLGPITLTRRACEDLIQNRETRYIELLARAERLELSAQFLVIYCADAESPLRFSRLP